MLSLNKDKRSLLFCMLIGDGCLTFSGRKSNNKLRGVSFQLTHGDTQVDYLNWKRDLLQEISGRKINISSILVKGDKNYHISHRARLTMRRFRAWRKFCYPNNKKDISKILPYILHPEFALAIWLMDDGTCNHKKVDGYCELRLHTDSEKKESVEFAINWLKKHFDIEPKLYMRKQKNKQYPTIRFNKKCGLKIWGIVRELILNIPSMKYKFRHFEHFYQKYIKIAHSTQWVMI